MSGAQSSLISALSQHFTQVSLYFSVEHIIGFLSHRCTTVQRKEELWTVYNCHQASEHCRHCHFHSVLHVSKSPFVLFIIKSKENRKLYVYKIYYFFTRAIKSSVFSLCYRTTERKIIVVGYSCPLRVYVLSIQASLVAFLK